MEVKEAISFICNLAVNSYKSKTHDIEKEHQKIVDIKKLLQQGEKYRLMWGWLDNTISAYYGDPKYFREYSTKEIIKIMSELEQKYFPKGM